MDDRAPYKPVIKDGWLYGRGSADNRPAAAALYSMKYLKEQGVLLEHTIRLYLGCSEERGMEDIEYYTSHYPAPEFFLYSGCLISSVYGEKGIVEGIFMCHTEGPCDRFFGRSGVQCGSGRGTVWLSRTTCDAVRDYVDSLDNPQDFTVEGGSQIVIKAAGKNSTCRLSEGSDSAG